MKTVHNYEYIIHTRCDPVIPTIVHTCFAVPCFERNIGMLLQWKYKNKNIISNPNSYKKS